MSKQRVIVVTGGGSGMGRAIAQRFAENGDQVHILGRRAEKLTETAKGYDNIVCHTADLTDPASLEKAAAEILGSDKTVDVLINNAGGNQKTPDNATLIEATVSFKNIVAANLRTAFSMIFVFESHMARPGGRIISVTSSAAFAGSSLGGASGQAYSAAKSAVHGMSRTLANSLAADGITVNCIAPGVVDDTEFFGGTGVADERREMYLSKIPLKRFGQPKDIAAAAFYLASEEAGFITGEILNINGGQQFGR